MIVDWSREEIRLKQRWVFAMFRYDVDGCWGGLGVVAGRSTPARLRITKQLLPLVESSDSFSCRCLALILTHVLP